MANFKEQNVAELVKSTGAVKATSRELSSMTLRFAVPDASGQDFSVGFLEIYPSNPYCLSIRKEEQDYVVISVVVVRGRPSGDCNECARSRRAPDLGAADPVIGIFVYV